MNQCYYCKFGKTANSQNTDCKCIHPKPNECKVVYVRERKFIIQEIHQGKKIHTDKFSSVSINDFFCWPIHFDPLMIEDCKGFVSLNEISDIPDLLTNLIET